MCYRLARGYDENGLQVRRLSLHRREAMENSRSNGPSGIRWPWPLVRRAPPAARLPSGPVWVSGGIERQEVPGQPPSIPGRPPRWRSLERVGRSLSVGRVYRHLVDRWGSTRDALRVVAVPSVAWLVPGRWALVGAGRAVVVARARNDRRFQVYHANYDQSAVWSAGRLEPDPVSPWTQPLRALLFQWLQRGAELTGVDAAVMCHGPNGLLAGPAWAAGCALCGWRPLWVTGAAAQGVAGARADSVDLQPRPGWPEPWALTVAALRACGGSGLAGATGEGGDQPGGGRLVLVELGRAEEEEGAARAWPVEHWCTPWGWATPEPTLPGEIGHAGGVGAADLAGAGEERVEMLLRRSLQRQDPLEFARALSELAAAQGRRWPRLWQWVVAAPVGQPAGGGTAEVAAWPQVWEPCGVLTPAGQQPSKEDEPVPMVEVEACGAAWQACRIVRGGGAPR